MQIIKFKPIYKTSLWGGDRIAIFKNVADMPQSTGEAWELSGLSGDETPIVNETEEALSINELVAKKGMELMGTKYDHRSSEFPVLIKFIDAYRNLSLQVHPSDHTAMKLSDGRGKNEVWYILDCNDDAHIYSGFSKQLTPIEIQALIEDEGLTRYVRRHKIKPGELYYIPAGLVHSIGKGCLILEIQDTSNTTYRIDDFGRKDQNGEKRELHKKEALESIVPALNYEHKPFVKNGQGFLETPNFQIRIIDITETSPYLDSTDGTTFYILIAVSGKMIIKKEKEEVDFKQGETILLPAKASTFSIEGQGRFIKVSL